MADTSDKLIYTIEVKDFASKPLEAIKKQLQGFDSAVERLTKAFSAMNALDLSGFQNLAKTLDPFLKQMQEIAPALAQGAKGFKTFAESAKQTEVSTKEAARQMGLWPPVLDKVGSGLKIAGTTLLELGKIALNVAKTIWDNLVKVLLKMGEIVKEVVVDSIKAYADFEEQMLGARRTMDLTDESTRELMKHIQQLALNFEEGGLKAGTTTATLAEIAGIAGQMGIVFEDGAERFDNFVATVAKASGAFGISAEETASALGIISNIFDVPIEKANELGGAITIVGQASVATVPELLNFMQRVGAAGTSMGLTANQAAALGGMFREAGLSMEVSGTTVVNIFNKMKTDLDRFAETLAAGGLSKEMLETAIRSKDAAGALEMVIGALSKIAATDPIAAAKAMDDLGLSGRNATMVLESLMAQFPKFAEYVKMIEDPMANIKALNDAYEASLRGLNKQWDATKNIMTIIAQIIGEKLSMALANLLEKYLNPFLLKFQEWVQNSPVAQAILTELGRTIEIIGAAIGNLALEFMDWLNSLDTLTASTAVHEWFAQFHSWLEKLMNEGFGKVKEAAEAFWNFLTTTNWAQVWRDVVDVLTIIRDTLKGMGSDVNDLVYLFQNWDSVIEELWNMIAENPVARAFGEMAQASADFMNVAGQVFQDIIDVVGKLAKALTDGIGNAVEGVMAKLKKLWDMAVGHSVFPDMTVAAFESAAAIDTISASSEGVVTALGSVSTSAAAMSTSVVAATTTAAMTMGAMIDQLRQNSDLLRADNAARLAELQGLVGFDMESIRRRTELVSGAASTYLTQLAEAELARQAGLSAAQPGAAISQGFSDGSATGWGGSAAPQASQPAAVTNTMSINFNGTNIVDEYSQANFAQTIQRTIIENIASLISPQLRPV